MHLSTQLMARVLCLLPPQRLGLAHDKHCEFAGQIGCGACSKQPNKHSIWVRYMDNQANGQTRLTWADYLLSDQLSSVTP